MQSKISIFNAYRAFWKYYADFKSRTSKEAFWKAWAVHTIITAALFSPLYYVYYQVIEYGNLTANMWLIPVWVYCIATIVPTISIIVRRLSDIDRNGCWIFLFLIPFFGQVVFIIMLVRPTAPYDVYPGKSGKGPYSEDQGQKNDQYAWQPYLYGYPQPYTQPPYGQQPYIQQPYAQPPYAQYPYGFPQPRPAPLPPPRQFRPGAGTGRAFWAVILSAILMFASLGYSIAANNYLNENIDRYIKAFIGDIYSGFFDIPFDYYGSPWNDFYPYGGYDEWDGYFDDGYGWDGFSGEDYALSEEEQVAIDLVREGVLPGFPDFSIEEVLLSRVDDGGLYWDCFEDFGSKEPCYYTSATGYLDGSFLMIYAGFNIYGDGTIELYNLDDGDRDEYGWDAVLLYEEWYDCMLSGSGGTSS